MPKTDLFTEMPLYRIPPMPAEGRSGQLKAMRTIATHASRGSNTALAQLNRFSDMDKLVIWQFLEEPARLRLEAIYGRPLAEIQQFSLELEVAHG